MAAPLPAWAARARLPTSPSTRPPGCRPCKGQTLAGGRTPARETASLGTITYSSPKAGLGHAALWPLQREWVWHTAPWQKPPETPAPLPAPGLHSGHKVSPCHGHCGLPEPTQATHGPSNDLPALTQARVLMGKTHRRVRTGPRLPPGAQEPAEERSLAPAAALLRAKQDADGFIAERAVRRFINRPR